MKPILFAEDSEDDLFLLQRALKRAKICNPLVFVRDGREAVTYLAGDHLPPGCIVLDVKMPYRGGLEVLGWIRGQSKFADTPVLMMTSSSQDLDVRNAYQMGADAYLVKPTGSDHLDQLIVELKSAAGSPRGDPVWQSLSCNRPRPSLEQTQPPK